MANPSAISPAKFDKLCRLTEKRRSTRIYVSPEAVRLLHTRFVRKYVRTEVLAHALIKYILQYEHRRLTGADFVREFGVRLLDAVSIEGDTIDQNPPVVDLTDSDDESTTARSASGLPMITVRFRA